MDELYKFEIDSMFPRNNLVMIQPVKQKFNDERIGGIHLPGSRTGHKFEVMRVLKVGPGVVEMSGQRADTDDIEEGDVVLVRTGQAQRTGPGTLSAINNLLTFTVDGETFQFVPQDQIIARVQKRKTT